ncbi:cation:proton antiporter [Leptolinea tardivitalis]|uniref:cation:proton antiporter n=1 Tax=Leptolinea tardivitalis TaxID=229920 RepID=UPI000781114C|nr:cation:proton antiporter [Leptolinea tardivitalis]GAP22886.1 Kef-type K+ transport systems, membrane components [Leptolinea tardivitalis]
MTNFLQLLTALIIILSAAKIAGHVSVKFGQPSVFGELLIGIILGPSLVNLINLPFISDMHLIDTIDEMAEIGVLLLMFLAGIELHLRELARSSRVAMFSGSLGVIFPILLGFLGGILLGMEFKIALFVGLTLAATSVSISAQTLMELGYLKTRVGFGLLGAAVYDDIFVILLLSIFVASIEGVFSAASVFLLILRMVIFFSLAGAFGYFILPKLVKRVSATSSSQGMLTFTLVMVFIYGLSAELIGNMAAITGTFFAGLFFSRTIEKDQVSAGIQNLAYGFFVPIFFVSIGLKTNLRLFSLESLGFLIVMLLVAVISKILGSGLGAKIGGLSWQESYQLGNGMISRGEVGLIVASIGANSGLITSAVLTDIVIIVLISTLITPILLKKSFTNPPVFFIIKDKKASTIEPVKSEEVE